MLKKLPTKGDKGAMKNLLIRIPEDLHRLMRSEAAKGGLTVRDFVSNAIRSAVKKGGEKK
jgi:predicted HicB family RNase H-like nuclease